MLSPIATDALFIATLVALYVLLINGVRHGLIRAGYSERACFTVLLSVRLALAGWLAILGIAAQRGFFALFSTLPPRVALAIVPSLVAMLVLAFLPATRRLASALPKAWLLAPQAFRILIEVVLWQLAVQHRVPRQMTFEGSNFDVLTGLSAPVIAWAAARGLSRRWIVLWNWAGLALLTNVVVTALLAAPTRFQVLHTDPPNRIIGSFPYIWLPCFAVTAAYFLHFVSLRRRD